ncbi:DUF4879 domain-containing protein [Desulfitobacterium sp. PCE1]|uniref:DUF4879 domain-containing protein n=1 Tax=Desulfitobacterium sp. PCE1 TaxID=146907 RepID=UPI00036F6EC9|nr:DUF4879 domain-containing protein [Desulfitobacterium sp. PCE1]
MKKRVISILLAAIFLLISTTTVFAENNQVKNYEGNFLKESGPIEITDGLRDQLKKMREKSASDVQPMAEAPPLSYLEVYAAISSQNPTYEYFTANQTSSVADHGGAEMYIVTAELGYGFQRHAKIANSAFLPEVQYQMIDLDNDSIVDGWFYWWDASGYDSGLFTYENRSANYPFNTMFDSIIIK